MTAMERGYIANLCHDTGIFPHGNTDGGVYHADPKEKGVTFNGRGKTLTGSGPETWTHDHTVFGIHDLCGNVWEWFRGLRLMDGVLQVAENNDAAMNIDLSENSQNWKPVMCEEKPIRLDCTEGEVTFTTCEEIDADYDGCKWGSILLCRYKWRAFAGLWGLLVPWRQCWRVLREFERPSLELGRQLRLPLRLLP